MIGWLKSCKLSPAPHLHACRGSDFGVRDQSGSYRFIVRQPAGAYALQGVHAGRNLLNRGGSERLLETNGEE